MRAISTGAEPSSTEGLAGVELEVQPDVEQPGDVLGTLEVAAHPEEILGDPAQHDRLTPSVGSVVDSAASGRGAADRHRAAPRYPWSRPPASC